MTLKEKFNKDYSQTTLETSADEVAEKLSIGCECSTSCFISLDPIEVYRHRLNIAELTKNEIDFYLMGLVRASLMDTGDKGNKRQRKRSSYSYLGKKVCLYAFLYLENITVYQLKKIRSHIVKNGVVNVQHGNSHKTPHNAFPLDLYKRTETFLRNYLKTAHQNSSKSIYLPQPLSKIFEEYKNHEHEEKQEKIMGYTTFRSFFRKQFPHVKLSNQLSKQTAEKSFKDIAGQFEIVEEHLMEDEEMEMGLKKEEMDEPHTTDYSNTDYLIYYDASELSHEEIVN